MDNTLFTVVLIPITVLAVMGVARYIRKKMAKPDRQEDVQTPGKFDHFILKFFVVLTALSALLIILGLVIGETGMAITFLVITLAFSGVIMILRREYDMSYQENSEYFILKAKGKEYKVSYENIVDWQPSFNEIKILDETRADEEYISVNIKILEPEILLQKIVEMTFAGKFQHFDSGVDPMRENEIINYLAENNYRYLVEDYVE